MVNSLVAAQLGRGEWPGYTGLPLLTLKTPPSTPLVVANQADFEKWKEEFARPKTATVMSYGLEPKPTMGFFGSTAARPDGVVWRTEAIAQVERLLRDAGASDLLLAQRIFNPQLPPGVWTPEHGRREAEEAFLDHAVVFGIEGTSTSVGSMLEIGFVALSAYLTQRHVYAFIDKLDSAKSEDDQRARGINILDARYIERLVNRNFAMCDSMEVAVKAAFDTQMNYEVTRAFGRNTLVNWTLLRDSILTPEIVVSGSSKNLNSDEKSKALSKVSGLPVFDTALPSGQWNLDVYEHQELGRKHDALVNLLLVTNPGSKGALVNVGAAVFRAVLQDSVAVIYLPKREEGDLSVRDYGRARALTLAHWEELRGFVPWVSNNVVFTESAELAGACASAAFEMRTRRKS